MLADSNIWLALAVETQQHHDAASARLKPVTEQFHAG